MVEIKAGPELDAAVAKAIGDARVHDWRCVRGYDGWSDYACDVCGKETGNSPTRKQEEEPCFAPYSTDLNYAFAAAEKCGLFDFKDDEWLSLCKVITNGDIRWSLMKNRYGYTFLWFVDQEPTPALAICAAILKLKGVACSPAA